MAQDVNFEVIQGDTWSCELDVTDSSNALVDFSNYTFSMEVKDREGGKVLCATASLNNGITVLSTGKLYIQLTPAQTRKFVLPRSKYQIQAIDSLGRRTTLCTGWFLVSAGVID